MLWNTSAIKSYAIEAKNGRLGTVSDILFDDTSWVVRWLVVDTGKWLSGRRVLLPLSSLGQPNAAMRELSVKLTMQQVKDSPDAETHLPVSRQMENELFAHYGLDPYWGTGYSGAIATPFVAPPYYSGSKATDSRLATIQKAGLHHLRSIATVVGHHIHASDGEIGHVADFLVDDADWKIRYVVVATSNWWIGKEVLISPRSVSDIDWASRLIYLDANREKVKHSRAYKSSMTANGAYEQKNQLLNYYSQS